MILLTQPIICHGFALYLLKALRPHIHSWTHTSRTGIALRNSWCSIFLKTQQLVAVPGTAATTCCRATLSIHNSLTNLSHLNDGSKVPTSLDILEVLEAGCKVPLRKKKHYVKEELGSNKILSETNGNKHEFTKKSTELWSAWIMDFPALINSHFLEKEKKGGSRTSAAALMGKISVKVRRFDISLLNKLRHIKARLSSLPSLFLTCYFDFDRSSLWENLLNLNVSLRLTAIVLSYQTRRLSNDSE